MKAAKVEPGNYTYLEKIQPGETLTFDVPYDTARLGAGPLSDVTFSIKLAFGEMPLDIETGVPEMDIYHVGFRVDSSVLEGSDSDAGVDCGYTCTVSWK